MFLGRLASLRLASPRFASLRRSEAAGRWLGASAHRAAGGEAGRLKAKKTRRVQLGRGPLNWQGVIISQVRGCQRETKLEWGGGGGGVGWVCGLILGHAQAFGATCLSPQKSWSKLGLWQKERPLDQTWDETNPGVPD